jgi:uncharacterized membrane protein
MSLKVESASLVHAHYRFWCFHSFWFCHWKFFVQVLATEVSLILLGLPAIVSTSISGELRDRTKHQTG